MNAKKPILCLDFDGVLHSYTSGWQGADVIPDSPVPGAIKFIESASKLFTIHVYSSRSHQPGGIQAMQVWLWTALMDVIDGDTPVRDVLWFFEIQWPEHKPPAFLTIDDRAMLFTGKWPHPADLLDFKPWNK